MKVRSAGLREYELRRYNGESNPKYIAYQGKVYDVSDCPHWRGELHQGLHFPGQDLTPEMADAPHGEEVFSHSCAHLVGKIIDKIDN